MSASIEGRVVNRRGEPVADANVIIASGPSHPDIAAISNEDGHFSFGPLEPGVYTLKAFGANGESDIAVVTVSTQRPSSVELVLP